MSKKSGQCLCGSVKVSLEVSEETFGACHCSMCRRWSGAPALAVTGNDTLKFEGEENIQTFVSSDWAERGFCKKCGSHLFYRLKDHSFVNIPYGLLNDTENFKFTSEVYIDSKPETYEFKNQTHKMTEAEVLKAFGVSN